MIWTHIFVLLIQRNLSEMKSILDIFRGLVDWILVHLKKEGTQRTTLAILVALFVILLFNHFTNTVIKDMRQSLQQDNQEQIVQHRKQYTASIGMYTTIKQVLKAQRPVTGADYILYLEYHNGSENIATGYQFCKFDITMEVLSDSMPYIIIDDYKDENLYRYDILISERVVKSRVASFTGTELASIDRNFNNMVNPYNKIHHIVFYNIEYGSMIAGTLIFLYEYGVPEYRAVTNCGSEIEKIIYEYIKKDNQ